MRKITFDEQKELAKYMIDVWENDLNEYDIMNLGFQIDILINKESNGRNYHWEKTPSVWAEEIANEICEDGRFELLEKDEE